MKNVVFVLALSLLAFGAQAQQDSGPAAVHTAITPSDSANLTENGTASGVLLCRAIYIEGAGDISITDVLGTTIIYTVPSGTLLPFRPLRVNSTSTTATGISCWRNNRIEPIR